LTQYLREEEDEMTKVEFLEQFQVQHLNPQVTKGNEGDTPQMIYHIEERKRN